MSLIVPSFFPAGLLAATLALNPVGSGGTLWILNGLFSAAAYASMLNNVVKYSPKKAMIASMNFFELKPRESDVDGAPPRVRPGVEYRGTGAAPASLTAFSTAAMRAD